MMDRDLHFHIRYHPFECNIYSFIQRTYISPLKIAYMYLDSQRRSQSNSSDIKQFSNTSKGVCGESLANHDTGGYSMWMAQSLKRHNVLLLMCGQREPQVNLEMQNEELCGQPTLMYMECNKTLPDIDCGALCTAPTDPDSEPKFLKLPTVRLNCAMRHQGRPAQMAVQQLVLQPTNT